MTSPLLELMEQSNFIIDISGITSAGKTTTNRIAASVWGRPSDIMISEFTGVGVELLVSFFNGMSIFVQDTHKKRNRRYLEDAAYLMADGIGRLRGAKTGGIRKMSRFHAVSFTTGEESFSELVEFEGSIARTIRFSDFPFKGKSEELEKEVAQMTDVINAHYGYAGHRWLEFIADKLQNKNFCTELKEIHEKKKMLFYSENSEPGAMRTVSYFASVMVTAELAAECFGWDREMLVDRVMDAFNMATKSTEDSIPKYQKAFLNFQSWVEGNLNKFIQGDKIPDRGEIYGIYEYYQYVAVLPNVLEKFLQDAKFPRTILSQWKDEGFLECDSGHRTKLIRKSSMAGVLVKRTRYYCIPWIMYDPE